MSILANGNTTVMLRYLNTAVTKGEGKEVQLDEMEYLRNYVGYKAGTDSKQTQIQERNCIFSDINTRIIEQRN
jgi:predicted ArsR family transcriptional regulator